MNHDSFSIKILLKMYNVFVLKNKHMLPDWKYFSLDLNNKRYKIFLQKNEKKYRLKVL